MINFEDELAWLNHRLDEQLKIWSKKHQLYGRIFYLLANSFTIITLLCIGSGFHKNINDAVWQSIFFTTLSILFFSWLARNLYTRLLKDGRSLKAKIHKARTSGKKEAQYQELNECQVEFEKLFEIELEFPRPIFLRAFAQNMQTRLLKGGHSLKAKIHKARTSGKEEAQCQ